MKFDYYQRLFILKEYNNLSNSCNKHSIDNNVMELHISRQRLSVFVNTIESLFDLDFYTLIESLKKP